MPTYLRQLALKPFLVIEVATQLSQTAKCKNGPTLLQLFVEEAGPKAANRWN